MKKKKFLLFGKVDLSPADTYNFKNIFHKALILQLYLLSVPSLMLLNPHVCIGQRMAQEIGRRKAARPCSQTPPTQCVPATTSAVLLSFKD